MKTKNIIIIGAAGRDFHNFNTYYRGKEEYNVVAFTATQIPDIDGRKYPTELAGELYPEGIPIYSQDQLPELIKELEVDECVFSYSDLSYEKVMGIGAIVNSAGANFTLLGSKATMIKSNKPVISVCAVRTGTGKSQTSRKIIETLLEHDLKVVAIRHPMPYGDLAEQRVQRYATVEDFKKHKCTIEEMEEYEPHVDRGNIIYAGVDYQDILDAAENDPDGCDVILWDGGNNDFSFYEPDLAITVLDPHRPGHELKYYPGEVCLRTTDVSIINKIDSASEEAIQTVENNIKFAAPNSTIIKAESKISVDNPEIITGKRVLIVEDGPTLTHGEMKLGAGVIAAQRLGAAEIVDPRPYAVGSLITTFNKYQHIENILPAMGYGEEQLKDLEATINAADVDAVIIGTPMDLSRVININKPCTRVYYDLDEIGTPNLETVLTDFIKKHNLTATNV
ncbi:MULTISPECIES: cyclic 2,3-diphosphoglycerate synthase [unclassified Sporosarcina]|uniref:cyclic 2,3-diphosphoglycerate synthase n=1 Tax=unclassified Sporosarcina TaxID=2647733 RepID=UPI000C16645B|nr:MULTISPECIES: cyclic 2,3-diphosphoglycerate synthase [unclassified Sporosarcina]PID00909.1 GTPase [Sporosarcina sp. P29]PID07033.1 GTPase [Sporosarcina sp. P30]PID10229.1 GTPase [Sporosarcina sp. P31]PID12127.1 GTPase [Sporosarcina sp. P32b]